MLAFVSGKIKPRAVRVAKYYLIAYAIYYVLAFVAVLATTSTTSFPTSGAIPLKEIGTAARGLVFAVVWYSYLVNSKRVAATYLVR